MVVRGGLLLEVHIVDGFGDPDQDVNSAHPSPWATDHPSEVLPLTRPIARREDLVNLVCINSYAEMAVRAVLFQTEYPDTR